MFRKVQVSPGEWNIFGTDEYGGLVIAGLLTEVLESFRCYDAPLETIHADFSPSTSLARAQPQSPGATTCMMRTMIPSQAAYPMTGVKTSLSTSALSRATSTLPYTTAAQAQAELAEIAEAENFGNEMQIGVDTEDYKGPLRTLRADFAAHPEH